MALGDGAALSLALVLAGLLRLAVFGSTMIPAWGWALLLAWWVGAVVGRLLPSWGMGAVEELRRIVIVLSVVFGGTAVMLFFAQSMGETSRFTLALAYLGSLVLVPFVRTVVKRILIHYDQWGVPTVVYGGGHLGAMVIRALQEEDGIGYTPIAVFDDDPDRWGDLVEGVRVLGDTEQSTPEAPIAILAIPDAPHERVQHLIEGPLSHYKRVVIVPGLLEIPTLWVQSRDIVGILGLEITSSLLDPLAQFVKRSMDLALVLLAAPLWVPLCAMLWAVIWLEDRHHPLFLQERVGRDGELFKVMKFRTMVPDAETVLKQKLEEDPALRAEWEANFKLKNDPRITRVGRFLRKTSLDELPQLVNVLKGEMSLVGPRPLPTYHQGELPPRLQQLRTRMRPGMTGLWQVLGRSDAGMEGLERWDAYYLRNWSIWLDIVVLVRTVRVVIQGSGAY